MSVFNVKHVDSVQFITPERALTATPGGKTLQVQGMTAGDEDATAVIADGDFVEWIPGDDKEKTVAGQVYMNGALTDGAVAGVMDAMRGEGLFVSDTTQDAGLLVWTTDFKINFSRAGVTSYILCKNVRWETGLQTAISGNMIPYSGRFYEIELG